MQLKSLKMFATVVETGSFVAAAERLHTVQSNITSHIKKLEQELGVQLIQRQGRSAPTPAGYALLDYARKMLTTHDEAVAALRGQGKPSGSLRLGAMETTLAIRLPSVLAAYHAAVPDVHLHLESGPTAILLQKLLAGELDCAFVAGPVEHSQLVAVPVFREQLVLVSSSTLTAFPSPEKLMTSTFIAFRQGCSYRQKTELLLAQHGIPAARIVEFGTLDAILGCVAAGMGYAVLPLAVVDAHRGRFALHSYPLPNPLAVVETCFVATAQDAWTPALHAFDALLASQAVTGQTAEPV